MTKTFFCTIPSHSNCPFCTLFCSGTNCFNIIFSPWLIVSIFTYFISCPYSRVILNCCIKECAKWINVKVLCRPHTKGHINDFFLSNTHIFRHFMLCKVIKGDKYASEQSNFAWCCIHTSRSQFKVQFCFIVFFCFVWFLVSKVSMKNYLMHQGLPGCHL